jgi:hypothetical protein
MMGAGVVDIKERILLMKMEYSVFKKEMKGYQCGWSERAKSLNLATILGH